MTGVGMSITFFAHHPTKPTLTRKPIFLECSEEGTENTYDRITERKRTYDVFSKEKSQYNKERLKVK
jgi:hypothetical protein